MLCRICCNLLLPLITTSQPTAVFIRTINSFSVSVILKYNCAHVLSSFVCSKARRLLCALPSRQAASTFYIYCHLQFLVHHLCTIVRLRSNYPTFSLCFKSEKYLFFVDWPRIKISNVLPSKPVFRNSHVLILRPAKWNAALFTYLSFPHLW